ncbi:MAG: DUF58 domain-containing protein [Planctomycetes bacterium]|nr:DUF58 domain-containing protein [Planctomycetota bacterium]
MTALLSPRILERLARLDVGTRRARGGRAAGDRAAGVAGSGAVFHDHRAYAPGDDPRYIDWSAWGRLRTLQVKVFELEESLDVHLLIDRTASLGSGRGSKLEAGCRAAAMIAAAALARGDGVRLQALPAPEGSAGPREYVGRRATRGLLETLGNVEPGARRPLGDALREAFPELRRRGAAVLVTDFLGDPAEWRRAVDFLLHRGVEVFAIHVVGPEERRPEFAGPLRLRDAETGETVEIDLDDAALAAYEERFEHHLREVDSWLRGRGVARVLVETTRASEGELLRLLLRHGVLR